MNERINQLAKQCYETGPIGKDGWPEYSRLNEQKFAELIVRECADLCDRFQARDVGMQPAECAGAIRKMFGVEE
jgi:hypothetical protein